MEQDAIIHHAMVNSFNILTGKSTVSKIVESGYPMIVFFPEEFTATEVINCLVDYFENIEMYENCEELTIIHEKLLKNGHI